MYNHLPYELSLTNWNGNTETFCMFYEENIFESIPSWRKCKDLYRIKVARMLSDGGTHAMYWFTRNSNYGGRDFEFIESNWRENIHRLNTGISWTGNHI